MKAQVEIGDDKTFRIDLTWVDHTGTERTTAIRAYLAQHPACDLDISVNRCFVCSQIKDALFVDPRYKPPEMPQAIKDVLVKVSSEANKADFA